MYVIDTVMGSIHYMYVHVCTFNLYYTVYTYILHSTYVSNFNNFVKILDFCNVFDANHYLFYSLMIYSLLDNMSAPVLHFMYSTHILYKCIHISYLKNLVNIVFQAKYWISTRHLMQTTFFYLHIH